MEGMIFGFNFWIIALMISVITYFILINYYEEEVNYEMYFKNNNLDNLVLITKDIIGIIRKSNYSFSAKNQYLLMFLLSTLYLVVNFLYLLFKVVV